MRLSAALLLLASAAQLADDALIRCETCKLTVAEVKKAPGTADLSDVCSPKTATGRWLLRADLQVADKLDQDLQPTGEKKLDVALQPLAAKKCGKECKSVQKACKHVLKDAELEELKELGKLDTLCKKACKEKVPPPPADREDEVFEGGPPPEVEDMVSCAVCNMTVQLIELAPPEDNLNEICSPQTLPGKWLRTVDLKCFQTPIGLKMQVAYEGGFAETCNSECESVQKICQKVTKDKDLAALKERCQKQEDGNFPPACSGGLVDELCPKFCETEPADCPADREDVEFEPMSAEEETEHERQKKTESIMNKLAEMGYGSTATITGPGKKPITDKHLPAFQVTGDDAKVGDYTKNKKKGKKAKKEKKSEL